MNTIYETNGDDKSVKYNTILTSSTVSATNETNGHQSGSSTNGGSTKISTSTANTSTSATDYTNDLKIIGQLKSIEKINEKRRVFLTNTISEYSSDEKSETKTISATNGSTTNVKSAENGNDLVHTFSEEKRMQHISTAEKLQDNSSNSDSTPISAKYTAPLKSPMTPPPKPPMLSRNRSMESNGDRSSLNLSPQSPLMQSPPEMFSLERTDASQPPVAVPSEAVVAAVVVTAATVPGPVHVETIQLTDAETAVLRKVEQPKSLSPEAPKQISASHYERLIEELRCPGCAFPMKSQVLLCKTGHSICAQCTRVLMLCPLCKEPFTNIRSLTVEALCSKAHFRCSNASGGCTVRLQIDLLGWHEKQCIYKPMKCFMGRVWGDCAWAGREANWKEHLELEHSNKVFTQSSADLIWNMGVKQKPLTGYYVFEVFDEMFNFYEVYDKERVLFTMTCTSSMREKKHNFAFEVTMIHEDNEALAITQKFPVHSEYDSDILLDGTCVSMSLHDLAKFIDDDKLLHYRVRVLEVKSPRRSKALRNDSPNAAAHPLDFQQTQIEGVNLKNVPSEIILTRKPEDLPYADNTSNNELPTTSSDDELERIRQRYNAKVRDASKNESGSESDPEFEAFIAKKWGTPQLHFNRKYLKTNSSDSSSEASSQSKNKDKLGKLDKKFDNDMDKVSISSTTTSYKKKMTNSLRKSFRSIKQPIIEMRPFGKKTFPVKNEVKQNA